jgi:hypothetical protein
MGTGDWARSQTEHVVMAVRGKPKLKEVPSTMFQAVVGAHSQKPEAFYKLVERCTAGSKIELFARRDREGWFCHGHAVNQPIATTEAEAIEEPTESVEAVEEQSSAVQPEPEAFAEMPVTPISAPPPLPEISQEKLEAMQEKLRGKKKNPPKVVVMKPTEEKLQEAMASAEAAEAQARVEELS